MLTQDLETGQHRNATNRPDYFTTAFFHRPDELKQEMEEAGFEVEKMLGVEGPVWFMSSFANHWQVPEKRTLVLNLLQAVEQDPSILGVSAHPMGIGRK
jgi:hypothetical protein